jgi:Flp pilus assembly protein TadD
MTGRSAAALARTVVFLLALLIAGCGDREKQAAERRAKEESDLRVRSQALIENGNQAYRAGDYSLAARRYAAAVNIDENDPAAFYGLGMALAKLGKDEEARSMYSRARQLVRQQNAARDSVARAASR